MLIRRCDFTLAAAAAGLVAVVPRPAGASVYKFVTDIKDPTKHTVHAKSDPEKSGPTTAQYLTFNDKFSGQSEDVAQVDWAKTWPQNGTGNVVVDYKGNWQFTGSFPSQPELVHTNRFTVSFVLAGTKKNGIGQAIAVTSELNVTKDGGSWSRTGNDAIVADLWSTIADGYTHQWIWHMHPEKPAEPPPAPPQKSTASGSGGNGSGGGSSCSSVLGAIGGFFSGGLSCL